MCSGRGTCALPHVGSPIRKSPGRRLFSTSPGLIAAVHVLHRLLAPRHPPLALSILTRRTPLSLCSFQGSRRRTGSVPARGADDTWTQEPDSFGDADGARSRGEVRLATLQGSGGRLLSRLSKLNSVRPPASPRGERVRRGASGRRRVSRGRPRSFTEKPHGGHIVSDMPGSALTAVSAAVLPRKEVIQPQLPLRLPCYDFTPITDPTFDSCLPCGLAHRLRVLPTFVV
jgi:hypothetical protein